ncbi:hypothetical protein [Paraburkholderia acidisoli]|uniref:Uncharacterized protein n=1 Tax=Paraburkholderia acidisoli TaxID=2571748 RepID=A0A7Z2GLH2_9BURK|nr:hypothetical protein [Paraburkholderia acidisoli]QGZ63685.1 hypothetical protein FAZ98_18105 [Paraburkholderia acidisoli]
MMTVLVSEVNPGYAHAALLARPGDRVSLTVSNERRMSARRGRRNRERFAVKDSARESGLMGVSTAALRRCYDGGPPRFAPSITMNLRRCLVIISTLSTVALTCVAHAQTGSAEGAPHQYGGALQRNLNTVTTSPAANDADAARRCRDLAKTYVDSLGPQPGNAASVGNPNYGRDGRNVESQTDLQARYRVNDAQQAYGDAGCK